MGGVDRKPRKKEHGIWVDLKKKNECKNACGGELLRE
jgi:hypothetical protein